MTEESTKDLTTINRNGLSQDVNLTRLECHKNMQNKCAQSKNIIPCINEANLNW